MTTALADCLAASAPRAPTVQSTPPTSARMRIMNASTVYA
jgi:hypothetical protein